MIFNSRLSSAIAMSAALSMATTPVAAADIPVAAPQTAVPAVAAWDADSENAERHRYRRYRHHRGVDAGDVIAGVLILGGIAAVASAASKSRNERRYPAEQTRYRNQRGDYRSNGSTGIDRAVDMCMREIERDVRVESVDGVDRTGDGWRVTGRIYNGEGFACTIDNDGRISDVSFAGRGAQAYAQPQTQAQDRQWDDARYAEARRQADAGGYAASPSQPAYPGGPVDGDYEYAQEEEGELGG